MSLFFRSAEKRAMSFQDVWGSGRDLLQGDAVKVALSLIPVYAATGLIADQIAASPWAAYKKLAGIPEKLGQQPALVTDPGTNNLDVYSWKFQLCTSLLLQGNAYGYIGSVDPRGVPSAVTWLRPDRMEVDEDGPVPLFFWQGRLIPRDRLIHIPWYVVPGSVKGLSPIGVFRSQIETGLEAQRVGKNFYKRGMIPSGVLRNNAVTLTADVAAETKRRFMASVSSSEPFVSGNDWDYTAIGLPQSDISFLSGIKANATQIAAIYRVAPEDVGGETSSSSLTYKSLEQDQIRFNIRTLRPVAGRVEAVVDRYMPNEEYIRFNLDASVRADLKTRYEAHQIAINSQFETRDEVRRLEERPPLTAEDIAQFKELGTAPTIGTP